MSLGSRMMTPNSKRFDADASSSKAYKLDPDKRNSQIWDAITLKDYDNYIREQEARRVKRGEQQANMRNFLSKQVKEVEFKKNIQDQMQISGTVSLLNHYEH